MYLISLSLIYRKKIEENLLLCILSDVILPLSFSLGCLQVLLQIRSSFACKNTSCFLIKVSFLRMYIYTQTSMCSCEATTTNKFNLFVQVYHNKFVSTNIEEIGCHLLGWFGR